MSREQPQQIRFCTSADGTRLAVATAGEGSPLVKAATWLTHVEKDPYNLFTRHWVAELAAGPGWRKFGVKSISLLAIKPNGD